MKPAAMATTAVASVAILKRACQQVMVSTYLSGQNQLWAVHCGLVNCKCCIKERETTEYEMVNSVTCWWGDHVIVSGVCGSYCSLLRVSRLSM